VLWYHFILFDDKIPFVIIEFTKKEKKKIVQPASKDNCGQYGNWGYKNRHPFLNKNH